MQHLVVGTAGHIDHGKTSLVRALTGVDTDHLAEEKRRGITIELGFAPWKISDEWHASIVDVPGHEKLIRTMVSGASGIDIGLLVVAADDGVMPQTREHMDILRLLNLPQAIIVITKCDLVDENRSAEVVAQVRAIGIDTLFATAPAVLTSSKSTQGLTQLQHIVASLAPKVRRRPIAGPAFLPIDRLFSKAGYGTIVTGTLLRGSLRVGDSLEGFLANGTVLKDLRVRGIQRTGANLDIATAGMRTAVNLVGRDVENLKKGMVVATAGAFKPTKSAIVWIETLRSIEPLGEEFVTVHLGTSDHPALFLPLAQKQIAPATQAGAILKFDDEVTTFAGERLVIRRPGIFGQATVAGGKILDPEPPKGKGAVSRAAQELTRLTGPLAERLLGLARESRAAGLVENALWARLPPEHFDEAIQMLNSHPDIVRVSDKTWLDKKLGDDLVTKVTRWVDDHCRKMPLAEGLAEAELLTKLSPPERHLANWLVQRAIEQKKLTRVGAFLRIFGHVQQTDLTTQKDVMRILDEYRSHLSMPPFDDELVTKLKMDKKRVFELLSSLTRQGELTRVAESLHYSGSFIRDLEQQLLAALQTGKQMSAAEFKELAGGVSRKWAIPLLEYFDRQKVTMRVGDQRKLHPSRRNVS